MEKRSSAHNLHQLPSIIFLVQGSGMCPTLVSGMGVQKAGMERNEYKRKECHKPQQLR